MSAGAAPAAGGDTPLPPPPPVDPAAAAAPVLGASLDMRVAEALADYCDKIVEVMQLSGKRFSSLADAAGMPAASRLQIASLYKLVLQARRAAAEFYVFSGAQRDPELKATVEANRATAVTARATQQDQVEAAAAALLTKLPPGDSEGPAFLHRIRGDFYAFWARVDAADARRDAVERAREAYAQALSGPNERTATRLGALFTSAVLEADIAGDVKAALALVRSLPPAGAAPGPDADEHEAGCRRIEELLAEADVRWSAPPVSSDPAR